MPLRESKIVDLDKVVVEKRLKDNMTTLLEGHWLWIGYTNKAGYGITRMKDVKFLVHRLSAFVYLGLDLNNPEQQALHKLECTHKACFLPDHLYIGSHWDNMIDIEKKMKLEGKFRCGHPIESGNIRWVHDTRKLNDTMRCRRCCNLRGS